MDRVELCLPRAKFSSQQFSHRSFTRIYARDSPFVRSVLLRCGVPDRDVDDLVQHVFIILWQRLDGLAMDVELRPWLYAVAVNLWNNYRRSGRWRHEVYFEEMPEQGIEVEIDERLDAERSLARMIRRMRPKGREVFMRVVLGGQTQSEVARELGASPKTVHARMRVVREGMRRRKTA